MTHNKPYQVPNILNHEQPSVIFPWCLQAIIKLKLVSPILHVLFPIICEATDDEEDEDFEEAEAQTAPSFAAQVIDVMALHLPPEKFIPPLVSQMFLCKLGK